MIKYGLKLWSNNTDWFDEAVNRFINAEFDFVELYSNSEVLHNYTLLKTLKPIPILGVHIGHLDKAGFHDFFLLEEQKNAWQMTKDLADFFNAPRIVIHPAVGHTIDTFWENMEKLDDERIIVESMPAKSPIRDTLREFGTSLEDLIKIKEKKDICLDITKFTKACAYHNINYKEYTVKALDILQPEYFHISGGDASSPIDEHGNLWEGTIDCKWVKGVLEDYAKEKDIYLVFENPKAKNGLGNDIKNITYFKNVV